MLWPLALREYNKSISLTWYQSKIDPLLAAAVAARPGILPPHPAAAAASPLPAPSPASSARSAACSLPRRPHPRIYHHALAPAPHHPLSLLDRRSSSPRRPPSSGRACRSPAASHLVTPPPQASPSTPAASSPICSLRLARVDLLPPAGPPSSPASALFPPRRSAPSGRPASICSPRPARPRPLPLRLFPSAVPPVPPVSRLDLLARLAG